MDKNSIAGYNKTRGDSSTSLLCHAPFQHLYFGREGDVLACCFNRNHVLGTYPNQSINEIWQGAKANSLRAKIQCENLNSGCQTCKSQIDAGNYSGVMAKSFDHLSNPVSKYPRAMSFELSNLCNLECTMCNGDFSSLIRQNREKKTPLSTPYDDAFAAQLEDYIPYLIKANFYGGEPFLISLYYDIWESMKKLNPQLQIEVQTNATILNNKVKGILHNSNIGINISIDSLTKEGFERIRKNATFETVLNNIDYFAKHCSDNHTYLGISACIMKDNWKELPHLVKFSNERNAHFYIHQVEYPKFLALWTLNSTELNEVVVYLCDQNIETRSKIQEQNSRVYFDYIKQIEYWRDKKKTIEKMLPSLNVRIDELGAIEVLREELLAEVAMDANLTRDEGRVVVDNCIAKLEYAQTQLPEDFPWDKTCANKVPSGT